MQKKIKFYLEIIKNRWYKYSDKQKNIILGLGLSIFAIFIWLLYGITTFQLTADMGLYFYGGRELLQGNVPYVAIFDIKPPMTFFVSAIGLFISNIFNFNPIVIGPRILFLLFGAGTIFFTYLATFHLFKDRLYAILSAIILISFTGFGWGSLSGRPKIVMIFFAISCLYYALFRKKWFIAGIFGSLSALTWQPGAIFPLVVIVHSLVEKNHRKNNFIKTILGVALPIIIIVIFFLIMDGLYEMLSQSVYFVFSFKSSAHWSFFQSLGGAFSSFIDVYGTEILFIIAGFFGFVLLFIRNKKNILNLKYPMIYIIFSFIPLLLYTCFDFQWWPDFIHLSPFIAMFASFFIIKISKKIGKIIKRKTKLNSKKTVTYFTIAIIILSSFYGIFPKLCEHEPVMTNIRNEIIDKGDGEKISQMESNGDLLGKFSIMIEDIGFLRLIKKLFLTTKSFDVTLQDQTRFAKYIEEYSTKNQKLLFVATPHLLFLSNRKNIDEYTLIAQDIIYMQLNNELSAFRKKVIEEKPQLIISNNWTRLEYSSSNTPNIPPELELDEFINEEYKILKQSEYYDIYIRK